MTTMVVSLRTLNLGDDDDLKSIAGNWRLLYFLETYVCGNLVELNSTTSSQGVAALVRKSELYTHIKHIYS